MEIRKQSKGTDSSVIRCSDEPYTLHAHYRDVDAHTKRGNVWPNDVIQGYICDISLIKKRELNFGFLFSSQFYSFFVVTNRLCLIELTLFFSDTVTFQGGIFWLLRWIRNHLDKFFFSPFGLEFLGRS